MEDSVFISLRPATKDDCVFLFDLRNQPEIRKNSINTSEIGLEEHRSWFERSLQNPHRKIFICVKDRVDVAMCRSDFSDGYYTLSWAVHPKFFRQGIAKVMMAKLSESLHPIRAEVKSDNLASCKVAESMGMHLFREENGICEFRRA